MPTSELRNTQQIDQRHRPSNFRRDIEGLRGIAVLIVVAYHCGLQGFGGGFIGVDVFFVLSGYLITGLLVAEIDKTGSLNLLQFYARRARRLLPASALTLLVVLAVGAAVLSPDELLLAGRAGRATALYLSNVYFSFRSIGYFAPDLASNPMLHTWSLAVEEQFYVFWPLLIMVSLRGLRSRTALVTVLFTLTALSVAISIWSTFHQSTFAFYQLPARAWEFGIGGIAVLYPRGALKVPLHVWRVLGWSGLLAILGSAFFISDGANFPGWIAFVPVLGTVAALMNGAKEPGRGIGVILGAAPLQFLGTLSYSWYLWHWPFLCFTKLLVPHVTATGSIAAAAAALLMAFVTHHLVENPVRFHPYLIKHPRRSIYVAAGITALSFCAATVSLRFGRQLTRQPEMLSIVAATARNTRLPMSCVPSDESSQVIECSYGAETSETRIVLYGDSKALQWFNPLQRIVESHGWKLTTVMKPGCSPIDVDSNASPTPCDVWRREAVQRLLSLRPSAVFVAYRSIFLDRSIPVRAWSDGTTRALTHLAGNGLKVIVMRDNPAAEFNIPNCLARKIRNPWLGLSCEPSIPNPAIFDAERAGVQHLPNIQFLDLTDQYCSTGHCWAVRSGDVMFMDKNHLSAPITQRLIPVLDSLLTPMLIDAR